MVYGLRAVGPLKNVVFVTGLGLDANGRELYSYLRQYRPDVDYFPRRIQREID